MSTSQSSRSPKSQKGKTGNGSGSLNSYARWSGVVFQMAAIVLAGYFGGRYLDTLLQNDNSLFSLAGVVTGVIASMVLAIRIITKSNK